MVFSRSESKPFRYVDLAQTKSSASLCELRVENLRVDCCLLMSKSRWGQINNQDTGIMYVDLTFHQPAECKLSEATITMDFAEVDPTSSPSNNNGLEITEYFGPRILTGKEREYKVSKSASLTPKMGTPIGVTAEAGGFSRSTEVVHASRWKFTGTRLVGDTPEKSEIRRSSFRQLVWHLDENKLDAQAVQHPTVHSAVAFHHGSRPFLLDLKIEAKMHRWRDRFKQSFTLPRKDRKAYTRSLIEPGKTLGSNESFHEEVLQLEQKMVDQNLHPVPVTPYTKSEDSLRESEPSDFNDFSLEPPSDELSALVGGILGHNVTYPEQSRKSVHSDTSSTTLVEPMESNGTSETIAKEDPTPSIRDDSSTAPKNEPPNQASNAIDPHEEFFGLAFFSAFDHLSRSLAALIRCIILALNELHAALEGDTSQDLKGTKSN